MSKKLAIIGGGIMASAFGGACHRIGYESHYFTLPDGKVSGDDKPDYYHNVNIFDIERIVETCKEVGIDGVVATTELTVPVTAKVAADLGLLGNPVDVAQVITDKYRNRRCIDGLSTLHSPKYVEATCMDDIINAELEYPIILKPINLGGKRGLSVVENPQDLAKAFDYAASSFRKGTAPTMIAEEFLYGGMECSVESISYNGKHTIVQITQKDSGGAPHCVELGHHQPAPLSDEDWQKVVCGVSDGLTAIGLTNGCCHTEIKIIDGKVYLIEFNARPGGDHISHPMIMLSTGFDFFQALVKAAMGELEPIDTSKFAHRYSGLYYIVKQTEYLKPIFDNCQNATWCVEKHFVTDNLTELTHNDLEHTNYMIYSSDECDPVAKIIDSQTK
ncbi:acetyl-CoA carboxylase biotin carboxylase subunit family protein [Parabacteroides sp. ZJ-118]|uniref:ATP-grasp domain-containing protein n=1 Tax=Parabacteroides sp. ZJ-118 TaxID=2709398 RepID=UPI0013E9CFCB|nr:ATP-grasp domain-containing protein [Parabacteroides sp. ZJ-118]